MANNFQVSDSSYASSAQMTATNEDQRIVKRDAQQVVTLLQNYSFYEQGVEDIAAHKDTPAARACKTLGVVDAGQLQTLVHTSELSYWADKVTADKHWKTWAASQPDQAGLADATAALSADQNVLDQFQSQSTYVELPGVSPGSGSASGLAGSIAAEDSALDPAVNDVYNYASGTVAHDVNNSDHHLSPAQYGSTVAKDFSTFESKINKSLTNIAQEAKQVQQAMENGSISKAQGHKYLNHLKAAAAKLSAWAQDAEPVLDNLLSGSNNLQSEDYQSLIDSDTAITDDADTANADSTGKFAAPPSTTATPTPTPAGSPSAAPAQTNVSANIAAEDQSLDGVVNQASSYQAGTLKTDVENNDHHLSPAQYWPTVTKDFQTLEQYVRTGLTDIATEASQVKQAMSTGDIDTTQGNAYLAHLKKVAITLQTFASDSEQTLDTALTTNGPYEPQGQDLTNLTNVDNAFTDDDSTAGFDIAGSYRAPPPASST